MKSLYEVAVSNKLTGEVIHEIKDVEEVEKIESLATGDIKMRIITADGRAFKYDNSEYDVYIFKK